ncbi:MAG: 30S ribosomal protein S7 [Candidatus Aenigmarchaeota archaeon ex4484_224]|nr:MAG: 30S ribosomal protein S7 [Candidatus Aenigmarchaeota archaeon ex4484_224]
MDEEIKIFGKWSVKGIEVKDPGLAKYINLTPFIVPKSRGKHAKTQFHKSKMNIVERLLTKLMVPGHRGKKHVISSARATGYYESKYKILKKTFEIIEKRLKKNPIEVLVRAIENAAIREEIASYQVGGIIVRKAVVTSPQRRVDLALRFIVQAAYRKSFGKKKSFAQALAEEIIGAYENNPAKSEAIKEKERIEKEAEAAR